MSSDNVCYLAQFCEKDQRAKKDLSNFKKTLTTRHFLEYFFSIKKEPR